MSVSGGRKVFCLGLSRTGTTSLCLGLEALGLKTKHFPFELFARPEVIWAQKFYPKIKRSLSRRWQLRKELKALRLHDPVVTLNSYDAFGDLPIPLFFKELDGAFPDAKFIYTTRQIDSWLDSMEWLLERGRYERGWTTGELADEMHFAIYNSARFDKPRLAKAFLDHEQCVREHFDGREGKLCTIDISRGELTFERICQFLGLPVPSGPFPTANAK
ncbi:hypothetical protein Enr13x_11390 [Stieleria neptunia]|uniref:Sulfotransferase family protein n=1 Tax=Stieleria neptunia TaxID=2527979 RepID=A0A518HKD9_9BACT|nr:sulfotransferase family protein [Stieleria neptunia]QDV41301.1 hypothetical protein Enr13x_11390 [Stieleria neptunia]